MKIWGKNRAKSGNSGENWEKSRKNLGILREDGGNLGVLGKAGNSEKNLGKI